VLPLQFRVKLFPHLSTIVIPFLPFVPTTQHRMPKEPTNPRSSSSFLYWTCLNVCKRVCACVCACACEREIVNYSEFWHCCIRSRKWTLSEKEYNEGEIFNLKIFSTYHLRAKCKHYKRKSI